jgi:hypothetical protein
MRLHPEAEERLSNRESNYPPLLILEVSLGPRDSGIYGPRKYTIASIPMATEATKIRTPASTLSPVSM